MLSESVRLCPGYYGGGFGQSRGPMVDEVGRGAWSAPARLRPERTHSSTAVNVHTIVWKVLGKRCNKGLLKGINEL